MIDLTGSMTITVKFDKNLKKITHQDSFNSVISEGLTFTEFLYFLFQSYPDIEKEYPPGSLALALNGKPPYDFQPLHEGDIIELQGLPTKIN